MIAAGDEIATRPYVYGGGHGSFQSTGYDCSGSVSYALHGGGLLSSPEDSSALESYGEAGPGRHITIYANAEHAFMVVDGKRFDTIAPARDRLALVELDGLDRRLRRAPPRRHVATRPPAGYRRPALPDTAIAVPLGAPASAPRRVAHARAESLVPSPA